MKNVKILSVLMLSAFITNAGCGKEAQDVVHTASKGNENRCVLTYATYGLSSEMSSYIYDFNESQDEIYVEVRDYQEKYDMDEGVQAMKLDMLTDQSPDLIDLSIIEMTQLASKNYLVDLTPYFDRDFNIDDFQWNAMQLGAFEDRLYSITPSYYISTVVSNSDFYQEETMDIQGISRLVNERSEDCMIFAEVSKTDYLYDVLYHDLLEFIDWNNGTCDFESGNFKLLMEIANQLPNEVREYSFESNYESEIQEFRNNEALFFMEKISSVNDYMIMDLVFGDKKKVIGHPVDGVCQNVLEAGMEQVGIASGSKNDEEAWCFLKGFLVEDYQNVIVSSGDAFPVLKSSMNEYVASEMELLSDQDEDGNEIIFDRVVIGKDNELRAACLTNEQKETMQELIDQSVPSEYKDSILIDLIMEEAEYYFYGQKEIDDVISVIQKRVGIYMSENM